jgi:hypothetical protein
VSCGRLGRADLFPSSRWTSSPTSSVWGLIQRQTRDADHRLMWAAFGHLADEGVPVVSYRRCSSKPQASNPNRRSAARRCGWRSVRRVCRHLTRLERSSRSLSPTRTWRTRVPSRRFCNHTFFFASRQGT